MAGRGEALDEGVVVRDVGGRAVALGGGEEQQPELVARGQAGGLEAPVRGDGGGGHLEDRRESVHGAGVGACRVVDAVDGAVVGNRGVGPSDAHNRAGRA